MFSNRKSDFAVYMFRIIGSLIIWLLSLYPWVGLNYLTFYRSTVPLNYPEQGLKFLHFFFFIYDFSKNCPLNGTLIKNFAISKNLILFVFMFRKYGTWKTTCRHSVDTCSFV